MNPSTHVLALPLSAQPNRSGEGMPSLATLTRAIARGDRDAFAAFYELWFDRVQATARRLTRADETECLDVVHDVMLKVAQRMVPLADERAVDAWMAKAILSTVIDRRRAASRRRVRESAVAMQEDASVDGELAVVEALSRDEQLVWLRRELEALPRHEREALVARFHDDRTFAEVGELLGVTGDAAQGRIRRALARLAHRAKEVFGHA